MDNEELKELIIEWFSHIEQMSTDRKTANGDVMDYQDCLDEIKVLAKNSKDFVVKHFEID